MLWTFNVNILNVRYTVSNLAKKPIGTLKSIYLNSLSLELSNIARFDCTLNSSELKAVFRYLEQ